MGTTNSLDNKCLNTFVAGTGTPTTPGGSDFLQLSIPRTVVGGSLYAELANADNTNAASAARWNITTGGSSAGDPAIFYSTTANSFTTGIDNDDSDKWKVSVGSNLGTNDALTVATTGVVSVPLGDLSIVRSNVGGGVAAAIVNTDTTNALSNALLQIVSSGAGGGDSLIEWSVTGQDYAAGIDHSDSSKWKLCSFSGLTANDTIVVTPAGEVTMPLQPAFYGTQTGGTSANATGDGTQFLIPITEVTDQGGDFASDTFTAPVAGLYSFFGTLSFNNLGAAHTGGEMVLYKNGSRVHGFFSQNPFACQSATGVGSPSYENTGYTMLSLAATDTIQLYCAVSGSTKTVTVAGSVFGGRLEV